MQALLQALRYPGHGHTAVVQALLQALQYPGHGHTAVVQALLQSPASVDLQSNTGKTALMIAAANGRAAIVRLLLAAGADITLLDTRGANAETFATRRNQAAAILLLQGESLRTCRAFGKRAFAAAARVGPTGRHVDQRHDPTCGPHVGSFERSLEAFG